MNQTLTQPGTLYDYWQRQTDQPLFPDIVWNRPERRDQAGRLGIIGGHQHGFAAVAEAYQTALATGAGQVRVVLPEVLRGTIPRQLTDVQFAPTNPSGSLAQSAIATLCSLSQWADSLLLIGDTGKNSQTAALYEQFISQQSSPTPPMVLTRDAIDLLHHNAPIILNHSALVLVLSLAQLQKLLRAVYYPKIVTFRMQLAQLVETLHKLTITYTATIVVFHDGQLVMARGGQVISQPWHNPMSLWRGQVASRMASYLLWTPSRPLEAIATSLIED